MLEKEIKFQPSTFETIDFALYNWANETMDVHCSTNKGWEKVDVTWVSGERAAQIKGARELRDTEGTLILPRITIERTEFPKDRDFKGVVQANLPTFPDYKGGSWGAYRVVNQKKHSNFANAQSRRSNKGQLNFKTKKKPPVLMTTHTMPIPVYVSHLYKFIVRTEYQEQANEILQPYMTHAGQARRFMLENEGHRFEAFFEDQFSQENNVAGMDEEERIYKAVFNIKVLGYLMGGGKNEKYPKYTSRENAVQFKQPRERVITQDEIERNEDFRFYRS